MDIFIQNVPKQVNHVEFRIFMRDKLRPFDILAFDVVKKLGFDFAILTVANSVSGRDFLQRYGPRGHQSLIFRSVRLNCKVSNRRGQPEPLKVIALLQKEEELRSRRIGDAASSNSPGSSQPVFRFLTLMTGVWSYDHLGKLVFDQKFKDLRAGSVIFGKTALVIYLESSKHALYSWHGRIDIPYAILEHTIPSVENGQHGSITLTLKSPPKIYQIVGTDGLHLYTGGEPVVAVTALEMAMARLKVSDQSRRSAQLERLCELQPSHDKTSALCMVYKVILPKLDLVYQAWAFLEHFTVPEIHCWKTMVSCELTESIENDLAKLEASLVHSHLDFTVQFQILALVLEGTVTPTKILELVSYIWSISQKHGSRLTSLALISLGRQIPTPGPHVTANDFRVHTLRKELDAGLLNAQKAESAYHDLHGQHKRREHLALTYKTTVTPTGMILRGPDWSVSNRVLRKYSRYTGYFMRVAFADEDGLSVFHDPKAFQSQVYARFRKVLSEGIWIAGRRFEFLGFSHASLRCHETWFMAPFVQGSATVHAKDVIKDLGDFTNIHCSAKCAARIGQAFSDTVFAVEIPDTALVLETKADIQRNGRTFSDGCGSMSLELFQQVWRILPPERRSKRPTVLQIRYRGAKGVLSLDTSLIGEQLHIRGSMTKYTATAGWKDLELCGAAYRPLTMFLNHQFIKILEDLGVPLRNFLEVQNEACRVLEKAIKHPLNAASFLEYSHTGVQAKVPRLFELMHYIGLSFQTDRFLTDIVEVTAMNSLRDLKYRARVPIEKGYLLYGIMDETNTLKEGEVYIVTQDQTESGRMENKVLLGNRVVVTRAPALHPGDVQLVTAVDVPDGSLLRYIHNCIVFSQQGVRDLPSQLSGGDLDGDMFHIIYDQRLIPDFTVAPADYAATIPHNLGRSVEVSDVVDFFIDFMQMDKLGQISNMHKIRADKSPNGTRDNDCILLSKLASDAVDFSKSGVPADFTQIPRGHDYIRPDFMAPGHNFVIDDLGAIELEEMNTDDIEDPDRINILDPDKSRFRYYRSDKALGYLYRDIDEKKFFDRMKGDFVAMRHTWGGESLVQKLERYIDRETRIVQWEHHTTFAKELREYYELNMIEIMDTLRPHRGKPLTELEVFSGSILGKKERASTRYIREANQEVRERFDRDVNAIVRDIVRGDEDSESTDNTESLPRAIACFKVSLKTEGWGNNVMLKSWKYVAAAVCLEQLWKFRGGNLRPL